MPRPCSRIPNLLACLIGGAALVNSALAAALESDGGPAPSPNSQVSAQTSLGLADLEQIALQRNPTLAQAAALVDSSRSKALQAGLYPNPTIGYISEQVGAAGTLGETQGAFVQQTIVTAGKLRLSRAKYNQEAYEAEIRVLQQQYRVLNGVRVHYYELLALARMIELHRSMLANAEESLQTHKEMFNTGQANRTEVLLAQIALNDARIELRALENRYTAYWQHLIALLGSPDLPQAPLKGRLEAEGAPLSWTASLERLLQESPELQAAQAHVVHDQITLQREKVEPIPNIQLQGVAGYDFETRNAVGGMQLGLRIPVWDHNQGTIRQVQADLALSQAEVRRVELSLRQRLADAFNRYQTALESSAIYRDSSVPQATEAYELQLDMYKKRRIAWPQVVMLQRNVLEVNEKYTRSLLEQREAEVAISGLLLMDGLDLPVLPSPGGHLEATPRPR
jgi:cobalt-zinc-cadmium efflux system outer membrane protein